MNSVPSRYIFEDSENEAKTIEHNYAYKQANIWHKVYLSLSMLEILKWL